MIYHDSTGQRRSRGAVMSDPDDLQKQRKLTQWKSMDSKGWEGEKFNNNTTSEIIQNVLQCTVAFAILFYVANYVFTTENKNG